MFEGLLPGTVLASNIDSNNPTYTNNEPRATPLLFTAGYGRKFLDNTLKVVASLGTVSGSFLSSPYNPRAKILDGMAGELALNYDIDLIEAELMLMYAAPTSTLAGVVNQALFLYSLHAGYKINHHFSLGLMTESTKAYVNNSPLVTQYDVYRWYGGYFSIKMANWMNLKFEAGSNAVAASSGQFYKGVIVLPF